MPSPIQTQSRLGVSGESGVVARRLTTARGIQSRKAVPPNEDAAAEIRMRIGLVGLSTPARVFTVLPIRYEVRISV